MEELKRINGMASVATGSSSLAAYKTIWVPVREVRPCSSGPHAPSTEPTSQDTTDSLAPPPPTTTIATATAEAAAAGGQDHKH